MRPSGQISLRSHHGSASDTPARTARIYRNLLDPKWKGQLGIEAKDQDWFASVADVMGGGDAGLRFFQDLVAANGMSVRVGHTLLTNMVISGEVPIGPTAYNECRLRHGAAAFAIHGIHTAGK